MAGVVQEAKVDGDDDGSTMGIIWRALLWSFAAALKGTWPRADWEGTLFGDAYRPDLANRAGEPLCGGYRFALWQISADLDYCCNYLGLQHFSSGRPCFRCACDRANIPWADLTPLALWRQRLLHLRVMGTAILFGTCMLVAPLPYKQLCLGLIFHVCNASQCA